MILRSILAENLKAIRETLGISQEKASEYGKISPKYWGQLEHSAKSASLDVLESISNGFHVKAEWLITKDMSWAIKDGCLAERTDKHT